MNRQLYIAAYDVSDPTRLRKALEFVRYYACGGQKSVHECYLNRTEHRDLLHGIKKIIDPEKDRFVLVPIASHSKVHTLGIAVPPSDPNYFYLG